MRQRGYLARRAGNGKPTARTFPAALELRMEVCGKPRKSTSKAGALSGKSLVRGTMQYSGDNDYPAPDAQQCV